MTDESLKTLPNDATAHEFRALCLFALGHYDPASAALYAVLSVGPGWDWTTMIGLYPDPDTYTRQLRALETAVKSNPGSAPTHFVLAYHYLTQGSNDAAVGQYKEVVNLQPGDKLSAGFVQAFGPKPATAATTPVSAPGAGPAPANDTPPAPPTPPPSAPAPDATAVLADWKAAPQSDVAIALTLKPENKFSWSVTQAGKVQAFEGDYTYGGDTLTLIQSAGPAMVGKLAWSDPNHFAFKIVGGPPADPGLSFAR